MTIMMHLAEMMASHDARIDHLIAAQITDEQHQDFGGFLRSESYHVEPRESGFGLSVLIEGYICKESRHFHGAAVAQAIRNVLVYMERHQRPDLSLIHI